MKIHPDLIAWQRRLYNANHRDRGNLLLHALTVPLFNLGWIALVASFFLGPPWLRYASVAALLLPVVAQGIGHKREAEKPVAFLSPLDFVVRFTVENTFTYWRFVFSGDWRRAYRQR